ncbi:response regulator [Butyrivibrio sp. MC2013]|uniref:response regulator n=1 Tax=Butyrivibrio sp. MC2013 TaxID=1280686 RepID=UPI0004204B47|nr:response regulator [Butyrivibrio sp. MC2013]
MKILLVDDDEIIRMGMRKVIEKAGKGWVVEGEASDGALALSFLDQNPDIDLIICDVRMPIMDGLELARIIQNERDYDPGIIMLSGYNDFEYVRSAFVSGAYDYILKPFKKDEFISLIEKAEKRLSKERHTKEAINGNNDFILSELLKKLSFSSKEEAPQLFARIGAMGVDISYEYFATVRLLVDQYYKQFSREDEYKRQLIGVTDKVNELLADREGFDYASCIYKQELMILLMTDSPQRAEQLADKIHRSLVRNNEEITVTVGVSSVYSDRSRISDSFDESRKAVMSRFYLGQKQLISYSDIEGKCIDMRYDTEPMTARLEHSLCLLDRIRSKEDMDKVFLDLSYCTSDRFRKYLHEIIDTLSIRIENLGVYVAAHRREIDFYVDYLNTFRELKTYMNALLQDIISYMEGEKEKKSGLRIEMAKEYIDAHYSEVLTLNDMADRAELNPSYFSNLFKQETGINFSEYLLNVRMEKAKDLLKDPTIKIYEVGSMVGYEDAVSFGRAFKKRWGISPKEFRSSVY